MIRAVKAHPGVFIGGAITYAVLVHFVMPKAKASGVTGKMGASR
jgi:hypothetical protein